MSLARAASLSLLAILMIAGPVQAQVTTAELSGAITDESQGVLPGATVTVTNLDTNVSRTVNTDAGGHYVAAALPPGPYKISVKLAGFNDKGRDRVVLELGQAAVVNFSMGVAGKTEVVTVTGEAPVVEPTRTTVSTVVGQTQIQNLPSNGRNYIDFALITPGVVSSPTGINNGSGLSFAGERGRSNNIMIDGLDNNDQAVNGVRAVFSQEAIREFQVITNSYGAEFGKATGGVVNIITKSGTNNFDGSAFMYFRDDKLNAREFFERSSRYDRNGDPVPGTELNREKAPYRRMQWGGSLGGPVKKDKTFFFLAFERTDQNANLFVNINPTAVQLINAAGFTSVQNGNQPADDLIDTYLAKLDHHWSSNHTLVVRGQYANIHTEGGFGGTVDRSGGLVTLKKDWSISASQTDILSPRFVNEARVLYARQKADIQALDPTCSGPCDGLQEGMPHVNIVGVATFGKNFTYPQPREDYRLQVLDTVSYFAGNHSAKAGIEVNHIQNIQNTLPLFFGGLYTFAAIPQFGLTSIGAFAAGVPFTYTQAYGNPTGSYPLDDYAAFIQDDWRISSRLVLKAGVRYQVQNWIDMPFRVPVTGGGTFEYNVPSDKNNIAPRVAAAWDVKGDGKTSIHAAYGLFYDYNFGGPIAISDGDRPLGTGRRAYTIFGAPAIAAWATPGKRIPEPAAGIPNQIVIPADWRTPSAHQVSVGFDHALSRDFGISVNGLWVRGKDQASQLEYNPNIPGAPGRRYGDRACSTPSAGCTPATPPGTTTVLLGVPFSSGPVLEYKNYAETWYKGVTVAMNKRFSHNYQFQLSYTLSKSENNNEDVFLITPDNPTTRFGRDPNNPSGLPQGFDPLFDKGPSVLDQRHRVVLSGLYRAPWDFMVAAIVTAATGRPFSPLAGVDINGNGASTDRAYTNPADINSMVGRNTERLLGTSSVDLRVSKRFKLGGDSAIEGIFEVFNLLDHRNFVTASLLNGFPPIDNNFGPGAFPTNPLPSYGQYIYAGPPRQMQLAARVTF